MERKRLWNNVMNELALYTCFKEAWGLGPMELTIFFYIKSTQHRVHNIFLAAYTTCHVTQAIRGP